MARAPVVSATRGSLDGYVVVSASAVRMRLARQLERGPMISGCLLGLGQRLSPVAWSGQPLQVGEGVVVGGYYVVALVAVPIALGYVRAGLASTLGSGLDPGSALGPVGWQPGASGTASPASHAYSVPMPA